MTPGIPTFAALSPHLRHEPVRRSLSLSLALSGMKSEVIAVNDASHAVIYIEKFNILGNIFSFNTNNHLKGQ